MDGRTLPQRAVDVLARLKADIIALQEVIGAGPKILDTRKKSARRSAWGG